jgi:hypothetical protein
MRPSLLLALVLVASLALIGVAAADAENFQNGPGMYAETTAGTPLVISGVPNIVANPYPDAFYADASTTRKIIDPTGDISNYYAFVRIGSIPANHAGYSVSSVSAYAWDSGGTRLLNTAASWTVNNSANGALPRPLVIEYVRSNQVIIQYVNGVAVKNFGTFATQPYYWASSTSDLDDAVSVSPVAGAVGILPNTWHISKDIESTLSGMYNAAGSNIMNTEMHASWTSYGDTTGATISIDGDQQVQAVGTEVLGIYSAIDSQWHTTTSRSGYVTFNLTQFMEENEYGRHTVVLSTAAGTVEEEFWYLGSATLQTNITFDRDIYAPLDSVAINSSISDTHYLPSYSFRGDLVYYDPGTGARTVKETWPITAQTQTHTSSVTSDRFPVTGLYTVELFTTDAGGEYLLDYDTAQAYANKIVYSGTVWDGQQGTVIDGATVSVTQGGTTLTDTTGSDGRFEIVGLSKDVLTALSGAKTGFVTTWSNMTPDEYKRYEFDLVLLNSSVEHTGEVVFGAVRCYPDGATVGGATVQILKDGAEVNSTTAAEKGFYFFDGLDEATTYTIAVQEEGYADYSNAVVTGTGGALTQFDPWLLPQYEYSLTVNLKNAVTNETITGLMAVSVGGQSVQTTTGSVTFDAVSAGACQIAVVGDGYDPYQTDPFDLSANTTQTLYITPGIVVVTTTPGMTPTPTPAIIDMGGTVYDGMTGLPIQGATVTVEMGQGGTTRTDTSDSNGVYGIQNLQNGVLTTVNATAAGYEHTPFSFTPQGAAEYVVNVVMYRTDESTNPTIDPQAGLAGAGGMVLGGDMHLPLDSPTVVASNGTWSGDATVTAEGVWYFDSLEPNTAYNFTASDEGYITNTVGATMGGPDSFTVVEIVLAGVYDVTIEIHDAESYAIIYQPISLTLSDGTKGNTSTGSYTFNNLQYASYVVTAASEGYTAGGLSFVAYGDHTEYLYLSKLPVSGGSSIDYSIPPKHVELVARSIFGAPLSGVAVTVQGQSTTLPDPGLLDAIFGWTDDYSSVNLANATMTGTTGPDGAVSFLLTDTVRYLVTFTDPTRGISQTTELYPHDTQYIYVLGSAGATPAATMPNMTLWTEDAGATTTLYGHYSDPAGTTTALRFIVELQNGTILTEVLNQSYAGQQTVTASHAVNHTTGDQYVWGWRATTPERGDLEQWSGTTLHSRLIDLEIEEYWYFWISACFLFIFAGLFSGMTSRFGFILLPLFALLLWYIGWLDTSIATLGIAMIAGVLMYISRVQVG